MSSSEHENHDETTAEAARKPLPQRACEECKRKKTKCDMKQPICSLCDRIGFDCIYPTRRKPPTRQVASGIKKPTGVPKVDGEKLSRLIELLDNEKLENLLTYASSKGAPDPLVPTDCCPSGDSNETQQLSGATSWLGSVGSLESDVDRSFGQGTFLNQPFLGSSQSQGNVMTDNNLTTMPIPSHLVQMPPSSSPGFQLGQNAKFEELLREQAGPMDGEDSGMSDLFENFNQMVSAPWQIPGETFSSPGSWFVAGEEQSSWPLQISSELADHLIDLFFEKIQRFLPLFHRPSFHNHILNCSALGADRYQHLDWQAALVLNGMFALSARFSERNDVFGSDLKERCEPFIKRSVHLWDYARRTNAGDSPDLRYLQGSILVAFQSLSSGPSFRAWLATGVCVRMAYDLSLHSVDRRAATRDNDGDAEAWASNEEKRRAWWAVWEIDTFASLVACRPFVTDMNRMDVLLPISDEDWFNLKYVSSAPLLSSGGPSVAWKSLVDCKNQCEYAWFLVSNSLLRSAGEIFESDDRSDETLEGLLTALQCFTLALPKSFRLSSSNMIFDEANFAGKNWIFCTHLMIQNSTCFAILMQKDEDNITNDPGGALPDSVLEQPLSPPTPYHEAVERCKRQTFEIHRAIRFWSPDYMPMATPFILCSLLGPAALHIGRPAHLAEFDEKEDPRVLQRNLLELVLKRMGEYWTIGELLQELIRFIDAETPIDLLTSSHPALGRFRAMMPDLVKDKPVSNVSMAGES